LVLRVRENRKRIRVVDRERDLAVRPRLVTRDVVGRKSIEFGNAVCDYGSFVVANVPRKLLSDHNQLIAQFFDTFEYRVVLVHSCNTKVAQGSLYVVTSF